MIWALEAAEKLTLNEGHGISRAATKRNFMAFRP